MVGKILKIHETRAFMQKKCNERKIKDLLLSLVKPSEYSVRMVYGYDIGHPETIVKMR